MPKIAILCLLMVSFGCDNAPRVRLVRDNDLTFHFQWDKPLKEERIILVRLSGEVGAYNFNKIPWGRWEAIWPLNDEYLVYFPAESIISAPVSVDEESVGERHTRRIYSVELLAADLRNTTIDFPAVLHTIEGYYFKRGDEVILRDHPFFREYSIDEPSRLTFGRNEENSE